MVNLSNSNKSKFVKTLNKHRIDHIVRSTSQILTSRSTDYLTFGSNSFVLNSLNVVMPIITIMYIF